MDLFQKYLHFQVPYDAEKFTHNFNQYLNLYCDEVLTGARAHEIFEKYVKPALNSLKTEIEFTYEGKQYKFSILSGKATFSDYSVSKRDKKGEGKVGYSVEYLLTQGEAVMEQGAFEFDVSYSV
jgi:hypothetical protein